LPSSPQSLIDYRSTKYPRAAEPEAEPEPAPEAAPEPVAEPDGYGNYGKSLSNEKYIANIVTQANTLPSKFPFLGSPSVVEVQEEQLHFYTSSDIPLPSSARTLLLVHPRQTILTSSSAVDMANTAPSKTLSPSSPTPHPIKITPLTHTTSTKYPREAAPEPAPEPEPEAAPEAAPEPEPQPGGYGNYAPYGKYGKYSTYGSYKKTS
jgi:hypothetical protein